MPPSRIDSVQHYLEQGRRLRARAMNEALREAGRILSATVRRAAAVVAAFGRCAAHGLARRAPEGDCGGTRPRAA